MLCDFKEVNTRSKTRSERAVFVTKLKARSKAIFCRRDRKDTDIVSEWYSQVWSCKSFWLKTECEGWMLCEGQRLIECRAKWMVVICTELWISEQKAQGTLTDRGQQQVCERGGDFHSSNTEVHWKICISLASGQIHSKKWGSCSTDIEYDNYGMDIVVREEKAYYCWWDLFWTFVTDILKSVKSL